MPYSVSVVIPVYNCAAYLDALLFRLTHQSFRDFQLILVDDGSSDASGSLCDAYARLHANTLVLHQENAGQSVARNHGVLAADAPYICFVDADDLISLDYLQTLYDLITKYNADLALCEPMAQRAEDLDKPGSYRDQLLTPKDLMEQLCLRGFGPYSKIYQKALLLRFPYPEHQIYEDFATTYRMVGAADRIAFSDKPIYYYNIHQDSTVTRPFGKKNLFLLEASGAQLAYMQEHFPAAVPNALKKCVFSAVDLVKMIVVQAHPDRDAFAQIRSWLAPVAAQYRKCHGSRRLLLYCSVIQCGFIPSYLFFKILFLLKRK